MTTFRREVRVEPQGQGLQDVTREVRRVVEQSGVRTGLCNVFVRHTSAFTCGSTAALLTGGPSS